MKHPKLLPIFYCLLLLFSSFFLNTVQAQVQTARYISIVPNTKAFYEYLPEGYSSGSQTYPLIVFIHGIGELGDGSASQLPKVLNNAIPRLIKNGQFPTSFTVNGVTSKFIVISPQFVDWPDASDVGAIIDYAIKNYRVNASRVYLTGLSMGGGVTWDVAGDSRMYINKLAAIVPVCGASEAYTEASNRIADANLPVWATHNDNDPTVPVAYTNGYISKILARNPNAPVKKTIFSSSSHDAWTKTYDPNFKENNMNVYQWMLQYQKGSTPPVTPPTTPPVTPPPTVTYKPVPGKIEAEEYSAMSGVLNETTTDAGGGNNVGYIEQGDWMDYGVNVATAGTYRVNFRVAAQGSGAQLQLRKADASVLATVAIPQTGAWQSWTTVSATVTLAAGNQSLRIYAATTGWNINWFEFVSSTTTTPPVTPPVTPPPTTGGTKYIKVNIYGDGGKPYNNSEWNNWDFGEKSGTSVSSAAFKYTDGTTSSISSVLSYSDYIRDNGVSYGSSTSMAPAEVLRYASYAGVNRTFTISGLAASKKYNLELYASRGDNQGNSTIFIVNGNAQTIVTYNNLTQKASYSNIPPDAQGRIVISINKATSYSYFNGFILTELGSTTTTATASAITLSGTTASLGTASSFEVYPNPVTDNIRLQINDAYLGAMTIQIVDMNGAVKKEFKAEKNAELFSQTYSLANDIIAGTYIVRVVMGGSVNTVKIVKL